MSAGLTAYDFGASMAGGASPALLAMLDKCPDAVAVSFLVVRKTAHGTDWTPIDVPLFLAGFRWALALRTGWAAGGAK